MLESVSPYALLRASIPRPVSSQATAYDLFSVAQSVPQAAPSMQAAPQIEPSPQPQPEPTAQAEPVAQAAPAAQVAPRIPARRTHYISDIQTRHTAAVSQATFVTAQR